MPTAQLPSSLVVDVPSTAQVPLSPVVDATSSSQEPLSPVVYALFTAQVPSSLVVDVPSSEQGTRIFTLGLHYSCIPSYNNIVKIFSTRPAVAGLIKKSSYSWTNQKVQL